MHADDAGHWALAPRQVRVDLGEGIIAATAVRTIVTRFRGVYDGASIDSHGGGGASDEVHGVAGAGFDEDVGELGKVETVGNGGVLVGARSRPLGLNNIDGCIIVCVCMCVCRGGGGANGRE